MTEAETLNHLVRVTLSINAHALTKALRLINGQLPVNNKIIALALLGNHVVDAAEELAEVLR